MKSTWSQPTPVSDVDMAFGPRNTSELMPEYRSIPQEFTRQAGNKWIKFQRDWFFRGLKNCSVTPKEGVDKALAMRHLSAIQASFAPSHEHKEAAVAYLASLWFDDISYECTR